MTKHVMPNLFIETEYLCSDEERDEFLEKNKIKIKPHEKLGPVSRQLCYIFGAWVIGSSIPWLRGYVGFDKPKDIDIVVPLDKWVEAAKLIPEGSLSNKFGGFKFKDADLEVDVWADDIARLFMNNDKYFKAYQPNTNLLIGNISNEVMMRGPTITYT